MLPITVSALDRNGQVMHNCCLTVGLTYIGTLCQTPTYPGFARQFR